MSKDKAVLEWLSGNEELKALPLFGFMQEDLFAACIVPTASAAAVAEHLDGSRVRQYSFMLRLQVPLSQTHDDVNAEAMAAMRDWQDWLDVQQCEGNFPDFGDKCRCYEIQNLANMPQVTATYADNGRAVLQFPATIIYMEEK
ncbi:MAG: hypothetical protein FWE06_07945 [Oscillospiraceae bacterium]|nr:hypothetical protein [Oscillospiraceae bacterium]